VLYVYTIQQRNADPETYLPYFTAASACQARISRNARDGSLVQRYGTVLEELRLEVLRHNPTLTSRAPFLTKGTTLAAAPADTAAECAELGPTAAESNPADHEESQGHLPPDYDDFGPVGHFDTINEPLADMSPSSSIIQMTGWGQFDSLVCCCKTLLPLTDDKMAYQGF
jgi:hypothetical protein